jgi:type I restriction enzyme S subunit
MRPYLRVANVYEDRIDLSNVLQMNFTPQEFETYELKPGDILLNEGQSLEWVGRPAMYRGELPGACFQNTLIRFRPHPFVDSRFALLVFRHYLQSGRFKQIAKWTVNIAHLGAQRLAAIEFPVPPLDEQRRIVAKIEELFSDLDAGVGALTRVRANLKRYRASVLKAAVEGRLTAAWRAAHPDVEPADKLLARILAERRSGADHRRRKSSAPKEPPATANSLPTSWCWTTIGAIASTSTGGTPSRSVSAYFGGEVPWVKSGELGDSVVTKTEESLTAAGLAYSSAKVFPAGTLCIALYGATVGKLGVLGIPAATNQAICAIFLPPLVLTRFVYFYLESIRPDLVAEGKGGAQSNISNGLIRDTQLPLPPLGEQVAIVAEVERRVSAVDAVEREVDHALRRANRLRQAILKVALDGRLTTSAVSAAHERSDLERRPTVRPPKFAYGQSRRHGGAVAPGSPANG